MFVLVACGGGGGGDGTGGSTADGATGGSPQGAMTLYAGTIAGGSGQGDGTGPAAQFGNPLGVAADSKGNIYVADLANSAVRKIAPGGVVTTMPGTFSNPSALAVDGSGNVYVSSQGDHTISVITDTQTYRVAGVPGSPGATDGIALQAQFNTPAGLAFDQSGALYIADAGNHLIRKLTPDGVLSTFAGVRGAPPGSSDGPIATATFDSPSAIAIDRSGNLYVTDAQTIRKISNGQVATIAGASGISGFIDGAGNAARFSSPGALTIDSNGNVYVADYRNNAIRVVNAATQVSTLAGGSSSCGYEDGTGSAALFCGPAGVALDTAGYLYVGDSENVVVRRVTLAGVVTTYAGSVASPLIPPNPATPFGRSADLAEASDGSLYVADTFDNVIRKVAPGGTVTTVTGSLYYPSGISVDRSGNVYVSGGPAVGKVDAQGTDSLLAGFPIFPGFKDGTGTDAAFGYVTSTATDAAGNIYALDSYYNAIRKITPDGVVTTIAGGLQGSADGSGANASFNQPQGIAVDGNGVLWVADTGNHTIRRVTVDGAVTTIAGTAGITGASDGIGGAASFGTPIGIAIDGNGNAIVADSSANAIRRVTSGGVVTTIAGVAGSLPDFQLGALPGRLNAPRSVAVGPQGEIYVFQLHGIVKIVLQ